MNPSSHGGDESLHRHLQALAELFRDSPAFFHVLQGPQHVFAFANEAYHRLVGRRDLVGRPAAAVLPEAIGEYSSRIARVMGTGEPFAGREMPVTLARRPGEPPEERLIDLIYLPLRAGDGTCIGVIGHGTDVTEVVQGRRQAWLAAGSNASEARRLADTREGERQALARDLNEAIIPSLDGLLREVWAPKPGDDLAGRLAAAKRWAEAIGRDLDHLLARLATVDSGPGLGCVLERLAAGWSACRGTRAEFRDDAGPLDLGAVVATTLYRIAEEALADVARRGDARSVLIALSRIDGLLTVSIQDDGAGIGPRTTADDPRTRGMRERADAIGAQLEVASTPGAGSTVRIRLALADCGPGISGPASGMTTSFRCVGGPYHSRRFPASTIHRLAFKAGGMPARSFVFLPLPDDDAAAGRVASGDGGGRPRCCYELLQAGGAWFLQHYPPGDDPVA